MREEKEAAKMEKERFKLKKALVKAHDLSGRDTEELLELRDEVKRLKAHINALPRVRATSASRGWRVPESPDWDLTPMRAQSPIGGHPPNGHGPSHPTPCPTSGRSDRHGSARSSRPGSREGSRKVTPSRHRPWIPTSINAQDELVPIRPVPTWAEDNNIVTSPR